MSKQVAAFLWVERKNQLQQQPSNWVPASNPMSGRNMALNAYVPAGMTEAQWKAVKAQDQKTKIAKAATVNKQKAKGFESLDAWVSKMEKGAGHRMAKNKYVPEAGEGAKKGLWDP